MHQIVFFTQLYYPDMTTTARIMADLVEDLASYGMKTEVVCAQPTYIVKGKFPKAESYRGVAIRRVWSLLFDKNRNIGRILNSTSCFFSMLPRLFSCRTGALLIFNTNPALLSLLGLVGNRLKKQKYVILIHDLWPELPAHMGMIKKGGALYRIIDSANRLSLKYASGIVVLSEAMKRRILRKVPEMGDKIHIIHNWADGNRVYPVKKENNRLLKEFGLQEKKVVMYSGNLGRYQPLEVIIGAANELGDRNDILFLFAGDGGQRQKIQQIAASLRINNVMFIPFQPLDRLAESLSMADVGLIGIYPWNEGVIMPSKLYGLLAVGKPIICVSDPESEVIKILEKARAGFHSSIHDSKELAQKITDLLDNSEKARQLGESGRRYFLAHFERKQITKQWKDILEKVTTMQ